MNYKFNFEFNKYFETKIKHFSEENHTSLTIGFINIVQYHENIKKKLIEKTFELRPILNIK